MSDQSNSCQERGKKPRLKTRRIVRSNARIATDDKPILGYGSPFWTKAGLPYAMAIMDMIEDWTNERNEDGAFIVGTRLAACFWFHTQAVEIELKACFWGEMEKRAAA